MSDRTVTTEDDFVDTVYPTRDALGAPTGGKTIIRHTPDGREVARFGYDALGSETFHQTFVYNDTEWGLEKKGFTFGPDDSLIQSSVGRFNREGELIETRTMDACGRIIDRQTYSYTEQSVHYSRFDETGQLIETWTRRINDMS